MKLGVVLLFDKRKHAVTRKAAANVEPPAAAPDIASNMPSLCIYPYKASMVALHGY